jgi:hypothetical protein
MPKPNIIKVHLMKSLPKNLYREASILHARTYSLLADLAASLTGETDIAEVADVAFAMREMGKLLHEVEVRCNGVGESAQRLACALAIRDEIEVIKTVHVSAEPDLKLNAKLPSPKTEPEAYAKLMRYLGVPEELWNVGPERRRAVDLQWPGMVEYLTDKAQRGEPLPEGVAAEDTKPLFRLLMRRRKGVLED